MELFRNADEAGEILKVRVLAEFKVLAALDDQHDLVLLQLGRQVRLVDLPSELCQELGVAPRSYARYVPLPERGDCAFGFTFDGSIRRALYLQDLPDGQVVDVLPNATAKVRDRVLLRPQFVPASSEVGVLVA